MAAVEPLVAILDNQARIRYCNPAFTAVLGCQAPEGKRFWDLFEKPEEQRVIKAVFSSNGGSCESTAENGRRISWSNTKVFTGEGVCGTLAIGVEITPPTHLRVAVLQAIEREQRRIGQDLHDSLGQHLTGIALLCRDLQSRLRGKSRTDAALIEKLANEAIVQTRELSRQLHPAVDGGRGLFLALQKLATNTENVFGVSCVFRCCGDVSIEDGRKATQVYRIAQEAVCNAVKHGKPKRISIDLIDSGGQVALMVSDDGVGYNRVESHEGLGIRLMNYRARMIRGFIRVRPNEGGGTAVTCLFPVEETDGGADWRSSRLRE